MPKSDQPRAPTRDKKTQENRRARRSGARLAIIDDIQSCGLSPAGRAWGGARNRRNRTSEFLTLRQCEGLVAAAARAEQLGLPFNRHWTVHYERGGIAEAEGPRFVGRLLKLAGDYARRHGLRIAAAWVRENGVRKGGHVHILLHLPHPLTLVGRTGKWVRLAGGESRTGVSLVKAIGGRVLSQGSDKVHALHNTRVLCAYLMKGASRETGEALGLARFGEGGIIIGKRCGWTQNVRSI